MPIILNARGAPSCCDGFPMDRAGYVCVCPICGKQASTSDVVEFVREARGEPPLNATPMLFKEPTNG
jgi:hypothetical protein